MASSGEPTPEQLAEQIRRLKIQDLLLSTISTLGQLAYVKLEAKELDQARLAIDAVAALLPPLEGHADEQLLRDYRQLLANLRLAFTDTVSASGSEPQAPSGAATTASEPGAHAGDRAETVTRPPQASGSGSEPQNPESASESQSEHGNG